MRLAHPLQWDVTPLASSRDCERSIYRDLAHEQGSEGTSAAQQAKGATLDCFSPSVLKSFTLHPMMGNGINLHRAKARRVHTVSVSWMFRPNLPDGNFKFPVIYELASLPSLRIFFSG